MKKLFIALSILLLLISVGCSKKHTRDSQKDPVTVENFITELKEIERPGAEAFDNFLLALDSISQGDSLSHETAGKYIKSMETNRDILTAAAKQFEARSVSAKSLPVDDTLSKFLALSANFLNQSYQARSAAVANFIQFYALKDSRILEGYQYSLNQSKLYTSKAFFWMTISRQYASGMKAPSLEGEPKEKPTQAQPASDTAEQSP